MSINRSSLLFVLFIPLLNFSQESLVKETNFRQKNRIKETFTYSHNPIDLKQKTLSRWEFYDNQGRIIEQKLFFSDSSFNKYYKMSYPDRKSRVLIRFNGTGKEIERTLQKYDLSQDVSVSNTDTTQIGNYSYEYDKHGNNTKVWVNRKKQKKLFIENFFNPKNQKIKEHSFFYNTDGSSYTLFSKIFTLDNDGNVVKMTSKINGKTSSIFMYEYKKYDN